MVSAALVNAGLDPRGANIRPECPSERPLLRDAAFGGSSDEVYPRSIVAILMVRSGAKRRVSNHRIAGAPLLAPMGVDPAIPLMLAPPLHLNEMAGTTLAA